jgi:peroxiredoxin
MRRLLPFILGLLIMAPAWTIEGDRVDNFTLEDLDGKEHSLDAHKDAKAIVLFFIDSECPVVNRYVPRMLDLHKTFAGKGVVFFAINANQQESSDLILKHAKESGLSFPVLLDRDQKVADQMKVQIVPEAIVIDASRKLRYRGAIDDHKTEGLAKRSYVRNALDAILGGKDVLVADTTAIGCVLQRPVKPPKDAPITYSSHVARILNNNCVSCHRPGQIGPFSQLPYQVIAPLSTRDAVGISTG